MTYVEMLQDVTKKYGKDAEETGYFHWVFSRRERETVEKIYKYLMKNARK